MKTVMVFMVALSLFVTLVVITITVSTEKTRQSQSQNKKMKMEQLLTKKAGQEEIVLDVEKFLYLFGFPPTG